MSILTRIKQHLPRRLNASWLLLSGLFCAFTLVYFTQDLDKSNVAAIRAHGDGVYYYAYLRSMVFDQDLDFSNDYEYLDDPFGVGKTSEGKLGNPHPAGSALFWLPFLGLAHAVLGAGNLLGVLDDPLNGTSHLYQRWVFYGSLVWGFGALLLLFTLARRFCGDPLALAATLGIALASPLGWYMVRQPCFSHAISAFTVAAFAVYWCLTLYDRSAKQWALLGLLAGLAILVRPQNAGHLLLPAGEWLVTAVILARRKETRAAGAHVLHGALMLACATLAFLPQALIWRALYGTWFTIPQGETFMTWDNSNWSAVLFSSRNGLFAWTPVLMLGTAGLVLLALRRTDRKAMTMGLLMLGAIALQAYINGSAHDWWGGWAFGGRRFLSCSIYFGLGLAVLLKALGPAFTWLGSVAPRVLPGALVGLFILFNLSLMDDHLNRATNHRGPEPLGMRWRGAITKTFDRLYGWVGNIGSAPANWIFAAQTGASPMRFETLTGGELLEKKGEPFQYAFTHGVINVSGFGKPTVHESVQCVWAQSDQALLVLPLREPMAIKGKILLHAAGPKTSIRMALKGHPPFLETPLKQAWHIYDFKIPQAHITGGLNHISVEQIFPSARRFLLGATGRESAVEVTAQSAGERVGNLGMLHFGQEQHLAHRRGITLFTFDLQSGEYRKVRTFDTHRSENETRLFAAAVRLLPDGTGAALAVIGDASRRWTTEGDKALASLGAKESLLGAKEFSYVLIGLKGARPGQALEQKASDKKARVTLGRPPEQRLSGVAWGELRLDRLTWPDK